MSTRWPSRLVDFLHRRRYWTIAVLVLAAVGLATASSKIRVDNSLEVWFVEGDPALEKYDHYKQQFGNDEIIIIGATDPNDVFSPAALERIRAASDRIADHPKIRRVNSITRGLHVSGAMGAIEIEPLLGDGPVTAEVAAGVRARVSEDPIFRGTIVSDTSRMTLIVVEPKTLEDIDAERPGLLADIEAIVHDTIERDGGTAHLGGIGVIYEGLNAQSLHDSGVFVTLSYLVLLFGLWVLFRRIIWVVIGLFIVSVPIAATLGIAGLAERDMNMVTAILPTLIMTVGVLDLIHLIDAYDGRSKMVASLAVVIVPCIVNTFTDAVGFMALTSANMSAVRDFGWLSSVGLLLLLLTVLVIGVPAIARFGGRRSHRAGGELVQRIVQRMFRISRRHRGAVLVSAVVLFGVAIVGITKIDVDTYTIGFLDEEHEVRQDHRAIEREFGNYIPLELVIDSGRANGLKDADTLTRIDRAERGMEQHQDISRVTGLPEIVKRVNQIYFDGEADAYALPGDPRVVAEELLTYGFSADGRDNLDALVDEQYRMTHVTARAGMPTAREVQRIIGDLEKVGHDELGDAATIEAAGYLPLYVRIIQHITDAQIRSFALCFGIVAVVLMVLLRSVKLGLIALAPNLLPAVMTLGVMGFTEIRLDVATVLIASIAIGIAVNDTCHILFRYKHELAASPDDAEGAVERMIAHAGRPVVASSMLLMAGFGVLIFASVKSVSYFGLLSAVTVAVALIADLMLTPALLLTTAKRAH